MRSASVRRSWRAAATSGLSAALLAGCVTRPTLPQPESIEAPKAFKHADPSSSAVAEVSGWWFTFQDERLESLLREAEAAAPDLQSALLALERARSIARLEGADLSPQLALLGSASRARQSGTTGTAVNPGSTRNRFFAAFNLDWEIDPWGRIRKTRSARVFEAEAAYQAYGYALTILRSQVAQSYFRLRELDRRIGILEATISVRDEALELVRIRLESGLGDELEMSQARTEYANALAELERSRGERSRQENALARLCGQFSSRFSLEVQGSYAAPDIAFPRSVSMEALSRRPDLAEALTLMQAASELVGARVAAFYPSLRIGGQLGYSSSETSRWFDDVSQLWSLGPSVDLPIFQGRARSEELALARIEYERLFQAYRSQLLRAVEEVESSLASLASLAREREALTEAADASTRAAALARQRYESGLVSYLEVVDTERAALNARLRLSEVEMQRLIRLSALYGQLGGTVLPEPPER